MIDAQNTFYQPFLSGRITWPITVWLNELENLAIGNIHLPVYSKALRDRPDSGRSGPSQSIQAHFEFINSCGDVLEVSFTIITTAISIITA